MLPHAPCMPLTLSLARILILSFSNLNWHRGVSGNDHVPTEASFGIFLVGGLLADRLWAPEWTRSGVQSWPVFACHLADVDGVSSTRARAFAHEDVSEYVIIFLKIYAHIDFLFRILPSFRFRQSSL